MRSGRVILLFAFVAVYIMFNREAYKNNMFQWDTSGYYLYLPAVFIYHDVGNLGFYPEVNRKYRLCDTGKMFGIFAEPGGKLNNKYAVGTSLFEAPFFLIANAYCLVTATYPADGFSTPYQFAAIFSNIFWVCMGLLFLSAFLRKYFSGQVAAMVTACIAFGTNLYCYTVFAPGMSHPYAFLLFAAILFCTDKLYRTQQTKYLYWISVLLGLVVITRPSDIAIIIIPIFWEVYDKDSLRNRLKFFARHPKEISVSLLIIFLVSLPQLSYWKYTTGHWIHYSYIGEGFNFLHPHIIDGLFSYRKGWLLYTPVVFIALLGLYPMWKANKKAIPVICIFFGTMIYVVFSWRTWWYGGGFSARAMIESLPVVALPLAYLFKNVYENGKPVVFKVAFSLLVLSLISLNLFQSYQYKGSIIHSSLMTKEYYWKVFGKTEINPDDNKYLLQDEGYEPMTN